MSESPIRDGSAFVGLYRSVSDWAANTRMARSLDRLSDRFAVATAESTVGGATATVGEWIRASWCYRWLTAEPDPDVIVIDLRETYTVGPIIRVIDRLLDPLADAWDGSGAQATGEAVADAPVRALGIVVAVAIVVESALSLVTGDLTQAGLLARGVVFGFAALAMQVPLSASELAETRTGRVLRAILEPPEPPDQRRDGETTDDETDDRD